MRPSVISALSPAPGRSRAHGPGLAAALLGAAALAGCSSWSLPEPATARGVVAFLSPYVPDVVQGNVVTEEQLSQVKPGMNRLQVRDVLGTPLIEDPFHAQRWDYVFTMKRQGFEPIARQFHVVFDGDAVQKVEAPELPSEDQFVSLISRRPLPTAQRKLELTDAEKAALPAPRVVAAATPASAASEGAASAGGRSYPPLEPR